MANYEMVEGEQGDYYDTAIYDKNTLDSNNNPLLISFSGRGITSAIMYVSNTINFENSPVKTINLTLPNDSTVRWNIQAGDIPPANSDGTKKQYYVQIVLLSAGNVVIRKTYDPLTMIVKGRLGTP